MRQTLRGIARTIAFLGFLAILVVVGTIKHYTG